MPAIERILCPVDFSVASRHAIEHAHAMAGWYHASITALHVYSPVLMPLGGDLENPDDRVVDAELRRVEADVAALFAETRADGITVDILGDIGPPARRIVDCAAALNANLIVMGTHGASGFEHLLLGSVTEKVLRIAPCPVLTVPPHARSTSTLPFKRLLCAVDFSNSSLRALDFAASLAQQSGAALTLLHVVEWPWHEPPAPDLHELPAAQATALAEFRRYTEESATQRLNALIPEVVRLRSTTATRVVHGKPYVELLQVAAADGVDLIVIGVHGHHAVDALLFGSTTNQVVRRATCPVLTLRQTP